MNIRYSITHSTGSIVSRQCNVQRKLHVILTVEWAVNFTTTVFATHKILLHFISHPSELIFLRIILLSHKHIVHWNTMGRYITRIIFILKHAQHPLFKIYCMYLSKKWQNLYPPPPSRSAIWINLHIQVSEGERGKPG